MLEIREMTADDIQKVAKLEQELFSRPWSADGFKKSLEQSNTIYLVALIKGELAGYCGLRQVLDEADITNVAVDCRFRQQGVASSMLKELFAQAKNRGTLFFALEVRAGNTAARALYRKLGFTEAGIRKNFYEKPKEDAIMMWNRG